MNVIRKQRQRQAREELLLDIAYDLVVEGGYYGLQMDRLATAAEYSKGTIYQHFTSKEDILIALTARTMRERSDLFERAIGLEGRTRERMQAIGMADMLFVQLYPGHFRIQSLVLSNSIWEKASPERQQQFLDTEDRCVTMVTQIVEDAVEAGDLDLQGRHPREITFGLWTMFLGVHAIVGSAPGARRKGIEDPYAILTRNASAYLDGIGWRPLTAEWDYDRTRERTVQEVFADEFTRLAGDHQTPA